MMLSTLIEHAKDMLECCGDVEVCVSVDVSTADEASHGNRLYADVIEVMMGNPVMLLTEPASRNWE